MRGDWDGCDEWANEGGEAMMLSRILVRDGNEPSIRLDAICCDSSSNFVRSYLSIRR